MKNSGGGPGRAWWSIAICVALLVVVDGIVIARWSASKRPPSFARGGDFASTGAVPSTSSVMDVSASTTVPSATTTSVRASRPARTTVPITTLPPTADTRSGAGPTVAPARPRLPALGTYTFAVSGTESATLVGSRSFAPQMTLVAHRGGGVGSDDVVLDQEFSTDHEEREIARYSNEGIFLTHEAGSLTFGLVTQGSDVRYDPPLGQIPFPLVPGTTRSGSSTAREPDGAVARVDDWTTRILGQETITVAGAAVPTWTVQFERRSRPGGSDQVIQTTRYWFDPVRGISVRWEESVHGERNTLLFRGTYDERYVATLQAFRGA